MSPAERFDQRIAERLCSRSEELTHAWLERLDRRLRVRPAHIFPREELLDHMPRVVERLAALLRAPDTGLSGEAVEHLNSLARLRRRQGYDVQEVLAELEVLGQILFEALREEVEAAAGAGAPEDPAAVAAAAARLHRGLAGAATVTAGTYREEDVRERRERARSMEQFARTLAHEIKNPLAAAEGAAHLLEDDAVPASVEHRQRFTAIILRNLVRARRMVDDVRTLAATGRGGDGGRREPLATMLESVHGQLEPIASEAGVRLEFPERVPPVEVDAARVELALTNLVNNAIKYADSTKPERRVEVRVEARTADAWTVAVHDNGVGIPAEEQDHVFERFFRGGNKETDGTGLGLAITREAIEQLGGRIEVESEPGRGTTFYVELPAAGDQPSGTRESATAPEAAGPSERAGPG